ncbi:hypothetical protein CYMTET_18449 [Cymbomonas tetramitiformis]|uniref:Uncharacterized protein n=1 Tax=Cymbomonas tetramitiformis TaxID=36881 RepID=A0AAE0L661_9CHLO|nr:hypothetical protein CYMTET_18449 [Cymbomonas tetramitiformis]
MTTATDEAVYMENKVQSNIDRLVEKLLAYIFVWRGLTYSDKVGEELQRIKLDLSEPHVWEEKTKAEASPREVAQAILKVAEIATAIESRKEKKAHSSRSAEQTGRTTNFIPTSVISADIGSETTAYDAPPRMARNREYVAALFWVLSNNEDTSCIPFELAAIGAELCSSEEPPVPEEEGPGPSTQFRKAHF